MLAVVSMDARGRGWSALALASLLAAAGCEPRPDAGTPGLEPPRERDSGASVDGDDTGRDPDPPRPGNMGSPSQPRADAGAERPPVVMPGGAGGAPAMMPPTNSPPPIDGPIGEEDAGSELRDTRDPWFTGLWVVEQSALIEYRATLYELASGGALRERDYVSLRPPPYEGYETGSVAHPAGTARCTFGERWESAGERRLHIEASCSDGLARTIVLAFPPGDAEAGLVPAIEAVSGESDWQHADRPWSFRKCTGEAGCFF